VGGSAGSTRHSRNDVARLRQLLAEYPQSVQRVLDTALAWSVINRHLDVAEFLLEHGADVNTTWSSHEPASILHELIFHANYESMQFLIDRGIDMAIRDYRWNGTAQGWALYAAKDEKMAQWLEDAERRREWRP
jgi:Ankyrin repeats (3 copies)